MLQCGMSYSFDLWKRVVVYVLGGGSATQEAVIKLYETMDYTLFGTHPYYARVEGKVVPGRYYYKVIDQRVMKQRLSPSPQPPPP